MTELERARAFLLMAQKNLQQSRQAHIAAWTRDGILTVDDLEPDPYGWPKLWQECFLAALSWVWEEQEKTRRRPPALLVGPSTNLTYNLLRHVQVHRAAWPGAYGWEKERIEIELA